MQQPSSALDLHQKIKQGEVKAQEVIEETYKVIESRDPDIGGFVSLNKAIALEMAEKVDATVAAGNPIPLLAGVPISIKDNINLQNTVTSCSSKMLANYVSPYDATVTQKLKTAMLPIVGKTNMDEFAMGGSTENSALQQTRNPWDPTCVPGGSSGGSAAVVASGQTLVSLGSDTGGSVRQPAAMCGLVGLKPTYGRVSRYGLVAFGSSLDQVSPFARNVQDIAALLEVIAGFDNRDSTTVDQPVGSYLAKLNTPVSGLRVGVINELKGDGMQPEVADSFQKALDKMQLNGATLSTISIAGIDKAIAAYYLIATAEASSNLARFDGIRYGLRVEGHDLDSTYRQTRAQGFGAEVKRRIMLGTFALSSGYYDAYYGKAQKVRQLLRQSFNKAFESVDVLVCPTSPTTAFKIGAKVNDPVSMYLMDIATVPVNLAGVPAVSVPCGFDRAGLPIGLQFITPHWTEERLLNIAFWFEQLLNLTIHYPEA